MKKQETCIYVMFFENVWAYTTSKVVRDNLSIGNEQDIRFSFLFGCSPDVQYWDKEAGIIGFGSNNFSFFKKVTKLIN